MPVDGGLEEEKIKNRLFPVLADLTCFYIRRNSLHILPKTFTLVSTLLPLCSPNTVYDFRDRSYKLPGRVNAMFTKPMWWLCLSHLLVFFSSGVVVRA